MEMEMEMELDFDFGFIGAPYNSICISETKMEMELDFQWTGGWSAKFFVLQNCATALFKENPNWRWHVVGERGIIQQNNITQYFRFRIQGY